MFDTNLLLLVDVGWMAKIKHPSLFGNPPMDPLPNKSLIGHTSKTVLSRACLWEGNNDDEVSLALHDLGYR